SCAQPRPLRSFPTRRSSDLPHGRRPPHCQCPAGSFFECRAVLEQELKFFVPESARPGLLTAFEAVRTGSITLNAIYFDTPERERSEEHTSELQSRENLVCRL